MSSSVAPRALSALLGAALLAASSFAAAQGGKPPSQGPTQSSPTRNRQVGPQRSGDDEPSGPTPSSPSGTSLGEPTATVPTDPLAVPEGVADRIGSDYDGRPPSPEGSIHRSYFPLFEERRGDYRLRLLPPLYLESTRGLDPATGARTEKTDRESLTAMVFYQRRSPNVDADVLFPLAWRVRERQNHVLVLGPLVHREAPKENDNWLAPLYFQGKREKGGYFHAPALLTTSRWDDKSAFTIAGLYFRDRKESDVDWGVAPFVFRGDNGNEDGARKTYTLVPPALFYQRTSELDERSLTVVGPVIAESTAKRSIFDVAPLFFSISGKPQNGGVKESHVTLFPLFHYGRKPEQSLFVIPGYLRRTTPTVDTLITPFYSHATTRKNATSLTLAGPIVPLYYRATDKDIGYSATGVFPFYYGSHGNTGQTFATPLFARFESYNVSRTYWAFPTIVYEKNQTGWEVDVHPIVYTGRSESSSHTVLAPIFWDFASTKGRTTIGFPLYWRFADSTTDSVTQVAANTLYRQKRVSGGLDWEFHLLPLLSYGQDPTGHFWNVLFGLAGYSRHGAYSEARAFWLPIPLSSGPAAAQSANAR